MGIRNIEFCQVYPGQRCPIDCKRGQFVRNRSNFSGGNYADTPPCKIIESGQMEKPVYDVDDRPERI